MNRLPYLLTLPLLFVALLGAPASSATALETSTIIDFQPVEPGEGWLLMSSGLYWTSDEGTSWQDITPPVNNAEAIAAVAFTDKSLGRALLGEGTSHTLAVTADGGATWQRQPLDLPGLADSLAPPARAYLGWRDALHGWLAFKLATGSNFSLGLLYVTDDGGLTWQQRTAPLGEPVTFADEEAAWTAGGPAGDELLRTTDGGDSWESIHPAGPDAHYLLPKFDDAQHGLLPVVGADGDSVRADFYQTGDGGQTWSLVGSQPLAEGTPVSNELPLSLLDSANFLLVVPRSDQMLRSSGLQLGSLANTDGASAAISLLKMISLEAGWARSDSGECTPASDGSLACTRETKLLSTRDGGLTWQSVPLPNGGEPSVVESFAVTDKSGGPDAISPLDADTQPYAGQGFDKCGLPSISSMQSWWNTSPYNGFNLYIGGSVYACRNTLPTASYVSSLTAQGWRFFPTWVGPQAPCWQPSLSVPRVSTNTTTAYNQGVAEADAALTTAANLGLSAPDQSGTIIYYDMETYSPSDTTCRNAVKSFISGWTHELRGHNNLAGAYGNACYNVSDWSTIANVPDAVWLANWYGNAGAVSYMPDASVYDGCVPNGTLWGNHQRLRQYAGDHPETWGGLSLGGIDSNALDGPLTVRDGTANTIAPSTPVPLAPAPGSLVDRYADTWLRWKTTGDSCTVHITGQSLDITSTGICSVYHLGSRLPGTYSWQVTASNAVGTTTGSAWQFSVRPAPPTSIGASAASSTQVNLGWALSADDPVYVDNYRVYMDGALAGTLPEGSTAFQFTNLACDTPHSFYVTSIWRGMESSVASVSSVTTPSCAPALLGPPDGTTTLSLRPRFTWQAAIDATGYSLQVSRYADFSALKINASLNGANYTPSSDLSANTRYYWRVRSTGPSGASDWSAVLTFSTGSPPGVPALNLPALDALLTDYTPYLNWTDSTIPAGMSFAYYQVQINNSTNFSAPLYDMTTVTSDFTVPVNLHSDTKYYWRVRAFNTVGQYSSWGGTWYFRAAFPTPRLVSPLNGSSLLTRSLTLDWGDVAGATSYYVKISPYSNFSTLLQSATVSGSSYTTTSDLPANTLLYWRVQARGPNGPRWSSIWSLRTGNPPSVPSLQYPANGATLTSYQPTLNWTDSALPAGTTLDHYQVQLARDSGFANMLYDQNPHASQLPLPSPLNPNQLVYWRVRAFSTQAHYSSWSTVWSFWTVLPPPALVSPAPGATLSSLRPTFDWTDVSGATSYTIQLSAYSDFSVRISSTQVTASTYTPSADLPMGVIVYWRVRANGANGSSAWVEVPARTFKIVLP